MEGYVVIWFALSLHWVWATGMTVLKRSKTASIQNWVENPWLMDTDKDCWPVSTGCHRCILNRISSSSYP